MASTCIAQQNQILNYIKNGIDETKIPTLFVQPVTLNGLDGWFKDASGFSGTTVSNAILFIDVKNTTQFYAIIILLNGILPQCMANPPTDCNCILLGSYDRSSNNKFSFTIPQDILDHALNILPIKGTGSTAALIGGAAIGVIIAKFLL